MSFTVGSCLVSGKKVCKELVDQTFFRDSPTAIMAIVVNYTQNFDLTREIISSLMEKNPRSNLALVLDFTSVLGIQIALQQNGKYVQIYIKFQPTKPWAESKEFSRQTDAMDYLNMILSQQSEQPISIEKRESKEYKLICQLFSDWWLNKYKLNISIDRMDEKNYQLKMYNFILRDENKSDFVEKCQLFFPHLCQFFDSKNTSFNYLILFANCFPQQYKLIYYNQLAKAKTNYKKLWDAKSLIDTQYLNCV